MHRKNILIYIQQHATLHTLFYLEAALHVSRGTSTHHQEFKQLYLQHLVFVTPVMLPAAVVAGSSFDSEVHRLRSVHMNMIYCAQQYGHCGACNSEQNLVHLTREQTLNL